MKFLFNVPVYWLFVFLLLIPRNSLYIVGYNTLFVLYVKLYSILLIFIMDFFHKEHMLSVNLKKSLQMMVQVGNFHISTLAAHFGS